MTQEEIVKYTDHLLAEFYKNCPKQLNKENLQVDIVLTDGDFSTLQNIMCEAITNNQKQIIEKSEKYLRENVVLYCYSKTVDEQEDWFNKFRKAMEK